MGTLIGSTFRDALAASMNGTDEYVYRDDPSFKAQTQGAISFWLKPTTVFGANGTKTLLSMGVKSGSDNSFIDLALTRNSSWGTTDNRLEVRVRPTNGSTTRRYFGSSAFSAGSLYHIVWQSNGTTTTVYVNGVSQTFILRSGTANASSNTTNQGEWFGDVAGTDHRFIFGSTLISNALSAFTDARFDEAAYFSRVLSGGEVTWIYNAGVPRNLHRGEFGSDLQHWWRMGDSRDSATTIYDEIGSDNLTLVNMDATNYTAP